MIYHYRCSICGEEAVSTRRGDRLHRVCAGCGSTEPLRRVFGFSLKPAMAEHFNNAVGKPVSSMRQFSDELKRQSDQASMETGIEHRYVPIEPGDHETAGATNQGIHERNVARSKRGDPLLPEIK